MTSSVLKKVKIVSSILLVFLLVLIINFVLDGKLTQFGILPRTVDGVFGILFAPFIHGGIGHLINNIIAFSIFSAICLSRSISFYFVSSLFIIIVSGVLIWILGREAYHYGASGWVFGLWSLSIATAWFERSFKNIVIAIVILFFYGGMIYGVLPTDPKISYESHLYGALAGILFAYIYKVSLREVQVSEGHENI